MELIKNAIKIVFGVEFTENTINKESQLVFQELVQFHGYNCEEHEILTNDGYTLKAFKLGMTVLLSKTKIKQRYICYFQHGLLDSSDAWVCNTKSKNLPYIMLELGFVVWIGNSRGNKYCKAHTNLDPLSEKDQFKFFDYSFDEMGKFDLPAIFDYITKFESLTNKSQYDYSSKSIIYFGHSQGCASFLAGACLEEDYFKQKVFIAVLLAPACRIINLESSLVKMLDKLDIDKKLNKEKIYEVLPLQPKLQSITNSLNSWTPTLFYSLIEELSDEQCWVNSPDRIKVYLSHFPSGTSLKSILHYKQMLRAGKFESFDYKMHAETIEEYQDISIPTITYSIESLKAFTNIIVVGGGKDRLVHITDVQWLVKQLILNECGRDSETPSKIFTNVPEFIKSFKRSIKECTPLYSYYEFGLMGHMSFLLSSNLSWFDNILSDIFSIIKSNRTS